MERHQLLGGKLHLYRRSENGPWHCSTYLAGCEHRKSTREESLSLAKEVAQDWFFELKGKEHAGGLKVGKTFRMAADRFKREYEIITQGQRHPQHVASHKARIDNHLLPFFGDKLLSEITPGMVQEYRIDRLQPDEPSSEQDRQWKIPSRSTMHKEIVTLRQVLKTAHRHGWMPYVPDLSPPYKTSGKITHRAWFSPTEYRQLYQATRQRAQSPLKKRWNPSVCRFPRERVMSISPF